MTNEYLKPQREIFTEADLECFLKSDCFNGIIDFVYELSESVRDVKLSADLDESPQIKNLVEMLGKVESFIQRHPPVESKDRYGNCAFRDWHKTLVAESEELLLNIMPDKKPALIEVSEYFLESWGNVQRIDYGTGHEANFLAFLYCLVKFNLIKKENYPALVLRVFVKYIQVMFKLQTTYWLEPAGSHGVWGLDDYHFLPFYFGAAQLMDHKHLRPKSIHSKDFLEQFSTDYLYFQLITNINKVKTESLQWHSPMLNDISGVKTWAKVNSGLLKMYKVEVMGKLPIMQHFLFGSLIHFKSTADQNLTEEEKENIIHQEHHHSCCTAHVPSAAAVKATRPGLKSLIPFD